MKNEEFNRVVPGYPWDKTWPQDGLETLGMCPVCNSQDRNLLHSDLCDNTFFCGAGLWKLWTCSECHLAYLDPRPTVDTISDAYKNYYTHNVGLKKSDYTRLSPLRKIRRIFANGFVNWKFGANLEPRSSFGIIAAYLLPRMRRTLEVQYRNLPKLGETKLKVLDLGCGDGTFLELAKTCGWDAVGLEPDERAVENARQNGTNVILGGIDVYDGEECIFDFITLKHVIEHVHDPVEILLACNRLLKPGGKIWIETPNIDSYGHGVFGKDWRGIEAPRHLTVFSLKSLQTVLINSRFENVKINPDRDVYAQIFQASFAISNGQNFNEKISIPLLMKFKARYARTAGNIIPSKREFLSVCATKAS